MVRQLLAVVAALPLVVACGGQERAAAAPAGSVRFVVSNEDSVSRQFTVSYWARDVETGERIVRNFISGQRIEAGAQQEFTAELPPGSAGEVGVSGFDLQDASAWARVETPFAVVGGAQVCVLTYRPGPVVDADCH
ncbi:hypothetical protein [Myxococcus sp. Y35]|uniref:hypothetical protein n=1 Tax=Pseudomyxococcus flavus TaxID=3115648 RepID=UPI003CF9C63D